MDETKLLYHEMKAALNVCAKENYSLESVNTAMIRVSEYYKALPRGDEKTAVGQLLLNLKNKQQIAKDARELFKATQSGGGEKIEALCPATKAEDLERAEISLGAKISYCFDGMYHDNVVAICSPFMDELSAQCKDFALSSGMDYREVDLEKLIEEKLLGAALGLLMERKGAREVLAYKGVQSLEQDDASARTFCHFLRIMRQKRDDIRQLILLDRPDFYFNDLYLRTLSGRSDSGRILDDDFSLKGVSFVYLPLPDYRTVKAAVASRYGELSEEDEKIVKAKCPLLGGKLLGTIFSKAETLAMFEDVCSTYHKERQAASRDFFSKCGQTESVLDSEWEFKVAKKIVTVRETGGIETGQTGETGGKGETGEKEPGVKTGGVTVARDRFTLPVTEYDYDYSDDVVKIRQGVQRVLDADEDYMGRPISVKQKCGMVLRYALINEDAMANIGNLSDEDKKETLKVRWTIGYAALTELMRITRGNLVFNIPKTERLYGQCCDNGATVRMNVKFLEKTSVLHEGCDTMLHELFHALQAKSMEAYQKFQNQQGKDCEEEIDLLKFYERNFGVTEYRITEAWQDNMTRGYVPPEKNYDGYRVQVYEADARAFAAEAWHSSENAVLARA